MVLNLCPLPWQKFVSEDYCAQFRHKLPPPEPAEPPQAAGPSQLPQLFKSPPVAKAKPQAQARTSEGYRSQYDVIDPGLTMTQVIKLVKEAEDLSEVDCLEHIHKDIIQKLEALKHGMDVQEVTLTRLFSMLRWHWKARTGQRWEGYRHTDQTTARRFLFSTSEYQKLVEKDRQQTEAAEAAATKKKLEDEKKERRKERAAARQERAQRKREREKAEKAARKQRRRDRHKKARGATDGELRCLHTVQSMAQRASP